MVQSLCGAGPRWVHAGPRRSGRVYIIESCSLALCIRRSPLYGMGPRGSRAGRQYCLRGGEAITGVGLRGSCAARSLAGPFHQEAIWPNCVARVHAGPRRSEREGLKSSIYCLRGGEAIRSALRGLTRVPPPSNPSDFM